MWFGVLTVMEAAHPEEEVEEKLFEVRIIVVRAGTEDEAREKAERFGVSSKLEYENPFGKKVIWTFREVLDIVQVFDETIDDGTEVYYSFIRERGLEHLRRYFSSAP